MAGYGSVYLFPDARKCGGDGLMNYYCKKCGNIYACRVPGFDQIECASCRGCVQKGKAWSILGFTFKEDSHSGLCGNCKLNEVAVEP